MISIIINFKCTYDMKRELIDLRIKQKFQACDCIVDIIVYGYKILKATYVYSHM